jgi:hypothetical protein
MGMARAGPELILLDDPLEPHGQPGSAVVPEGSLGHLGPADGDREVVVG